METFEQWAEDNFGGAWLGDKRLSRRASKTAECMMRCAGASLPGQNAQSYAQLAGTYRLLNNERIMPEMLMSAHREKVLGECREHAVVLCVQDTTELDYTGREAGGLGEIGNGHGRGLLQHSALAVEAGAGRIIGLLHANIHLRKKAPAGETRVQRQQRPTETMIWGDAAARVAQMDLGKTKLIHIADRGGDRADFLFRCRNAGQRYIVRAMYDRKANEDTRLWEWLGGQGVSFEYTLEAVPARQIKKRAEGTRRAKLQVRHARASLPPPVKDARYENQKPLEIWAVHVSEADAPQDYEKVEWLLLTSEEVENQQQARTIINYYRKRWRIEEWHRCLKQGCGQEEAQLKSAEAISRLAVMNSIVAVKLLQMRDMARDEHQANKPANEVMDKVLVKVAAKLSGKNETTLSVKECWNYIAKQGGWLGRKNDNPPGWITIGRGWRQIELIVSGVMLSTHISHDV